MTAVFGSNTSTHTGAPGNSRMAERRVPDSADQLVRQLAAMPASDPRRPRARREAIEAWLPLARRLARRYAGKGEPVDDLDQTAALALIKAIDRFDPSFGADFASFAVPTVLGEIKRHFRDQTWSVRVPRRSQELALAVIDATAALTGTLGRSPTVADIAGHLGIREDDVLHGLDATGVYTAASLSAPITGDGATVLSDSLGGPDHTLELAELRLALRSAFDCLSPREQRILALRFYGNLNQSQIGQQVGLSQMHISRLISRALGKLRTQLTDASV
jgi:RNA polymerase sigma-B factor